jgi:tRNA threonylcarbamoyladenosine biosynthesis protein TsaB
MLLMTLRTDKPEAELGLYQDDKQLTYVTWEAHRQLAETLHQKIADMLAAQSKQLSDVEGIVAYEGPGSFTGLRIGLSVGNALTYGLALKTVGARGDDWITTGIKRLLAGQYDKVIMPEYGAPVHITEQKR